MTFSEAVTLSAVRAIQLFLMVPLLVSAFFLLLTVRDDEIGCVFDAQCRNAHKYDHWFEDLNNFLIFSSIGVLFFLFLVALLWFAQRKLKQIWGNGYDEWGFRDKSTAETPVQKLVSFGTAAILVFGFYFFMF
ncbi:MAG: hypothetical protein Q3974_02700 [Rothia sp. (in: high G+C Gram-positive bacteria)]|nr:hypothetical protein [Rothia sp. (in: high G+C Gram-positive bacteria)]